MKAIQSSSELHGTLSLAQTMRQQKRTISSIWHTRPQWAQQGLSLIELMVGLALGLLVVAVGLGAILASRQLSATVRDASYLQQQAAYAFRVIGQQILQAGSVQLSLNPTGDPAVFPPPTPDPFAPVRLLRSYTQTSQILSAVATDARGNDSLNLAYQNFPQNLNNQPNNTGLTNCQGSGGIVLAGIVQQTYIRSNFAVNDNGELTCDTRLGNGPQAVIQNVSNFRVRYFIQPVANTSQVAIQNVSAMLANPAMWAYVVAIEVCLDMVGDETVGVPSTSEYVDCRGDGQKQSYGGRIHQVYRNTFEVRNRGLLAW